jgi:hypothetical protein
MLLANERSFFVDRAASPLTQGPRSAATVGSTELGSLRPDGADAVFVIVSRIHETLAIADMLTQALAILRQIVLGLAGAIVVAEGSISHRALLRTRMRQRAADCRSTPLGVPFPGYRRPNATDGVKFLGS